MTPNFLSMSIAHALHAPVSMQDQYAEFLQAQYHFHGLPNPRMELQEGEAEIVYCRDLPVSERCGCGAIGAKPVMIGDQVMTHHCENCWNNVVADANRRKAEYEGMVAEGVHPRVASRVMLAKK